MKTNTKYLILAGTLVAFLLPLSCVKEQAPGIHQTSEGEVVSVKLDLNLAPLVEMTASPTKGAAINTTDNIEVNDIKNLWILQFNGTADTSLRLGNPIYDSVYNASTFQKLIASSRPNRLVFVANTFAKTIAFGDCRTYADAKEMIRSIENEGRVARTDTVGGVTKHYPVMNGHTDVTLSSGATVSSTLKHSVAKVDVKIVNAIPSVVTIESVTLKNVPDRFNFITDYTLPALYPDAASFGTIDYVPTLWTAGEQDGGPDTRKFTFYTPANKRGTTSEDTQTGKYKGFFAPDKSTYAFITASYLEGSIPDTVRRSVIYTFYLGANLTDDYNIEPNGHYSYTFTINNKGDEDSDGRVEDTGTVDFCSRKLANSYIINPPTAQGSWRNYRIPVKRVWEFWKVDGKYEDNSDYALLSTSFGWVVDVIWSEFPIDDDHFKWVKKSRVKAEGLNPESDYFEFQVKEGVQGNCVIGIRRYTNSSLLVDGLYLWSWHMWVTDYKPDKVSIFSVNPSDNIYSYSVPGGNVHKYDNAIFRTGIYAGKVIMDRNLGARDIYYHYPYPNTDPAKDDGNGVLYYQFGRKDPFSGPRRIWIRKDNGGTISYDYEQWSTTTYTKPNTTDVINSNNVPYAINYPLVFIKSTNGYWTYNDKYNPTSYDSNIRWQDPEVKTDAGKSIFDPCPPGWKVSKNGTWTGFDTKVDGNYTKFLWNDPLSTGRNYFPNGSAERTTGTIFYPASGYLGSGSGAFLDVGGVGNYWSCSPTAASGGYCLYFHSGLVRPSGDRGRAYGGPVRCVQE